MSETRIGIDIGGSGIKAAVVDLDTGSLIGDRVRIETPQPAMPDAVADAVAELVEASRVEGPVGVGFPAVVTDGKVLTANNIDLSWLGVNVRDLLRERLGRRVEVANDADAAALGEREYGSARGVDGLVAVITFGTGIGSGLLMDGKLIPNVELGQLELDGHRPAEAHFSAKARRREGLDWEVWGDRANRFLTHVQSLLAPTLILVGGGVVRKWELWSGHLDEDLPVEPAGLVHNAGAVGAATLVR